MYVINQGASIGSGIPAGQNQLNTDLRINVNYDVSILKYPVLDHLFDDILPYFYCCKCSSLNCFKYSIARPTDDCGDYVAPGPGKIKNTTMTVDSIYYVLIYLVAALIVYLL